MVLTLAYTVFKEMKIRESKFFAMETLKKNVREDKKYF